MPIRFFLPLLLLAGVLAGCSGPDLLNALVPEDGYRVERDLPYGPDPRHRLDVYTPAGAAAEPATVALPGAEPPAAGIPTIVFLYGGNWESGSKDDYAFVGEAFASRGYRTVIPDYRLYPEVRYPAFLEYSAAALAWARARAGAPVFLAGHSAGAYNAAMLALDSRWLSGAGLRVCETVAAAALLAGPYDFLPLESETLKRIFGPPSQREATQPINYVDERQPPMLLIAGLDDETVLPRNSYRLAKALAENGTPAALLGYEDIGHIALVVSLAAHFRWLSPALDDIDAFLRRHSGRGGPDCSDQGRS